VIGIENRLPWRLRGDLARFKAVTMGHPLIMGRLTWESIGRPLPGRRMLVVSRTPGYAAEGATLLPSLDAALAACAGEDEAFVIGGARLFAAALPIADRLHLTIVEADVAGDTFMPAIDLDRWHERQRTAYPADEANEHPCTYLVYDRDGEPAER